MSALVVLFTLIVQVGCVSKLFYYPDRIVYQTPTRHHLQYEDVFFPSTDGVMLNGWFVPAVGEALGTVIHFHGNAQNMSSHFTYVDWLPTNGFNVFTFDYRGYGKSAGKPDRKGVYEDCVAAIRYIQTRPDVDPDKLLIFAQSIGGANAVVAVAEQKPVGLQAVIVDSSFYSYRSIVRDKIGLIPILRWFKWPLSFVVVGNQYSPASSIGRISPIPILLIHGTADKVVPIRHGRGLFERARPPKEFRVVEGGEHTDALITFRDQYQGLILAYFKQALGCSAPERSINRLQQ